MSRSGYSDDCDDQWGHIRWRGAVSSALNGAKGQAFLRELVADLDAMPEKKLVAYDIIRADGACCALGCVAKARGLDVADLNPTDGDYDSDVSHKTKELAERLGIAPSMAREIVYLNDEVYSYDEKVSEECRWQWVRNWAASAIKAAP